MNPEENTPPSEPSSNEVAVVPHRAAKPKRFTEYFSVYVTPELYIEIEERARAQNDTVSRFARKAILRALEKSLPQDAQQVVLAALEIAFREVRDLLADSKLSGKATKHAESILEALITARSAVRAPTNAAKEPKDTL